MALSQNMLFFDTNYGEWASVTGVNLHTETAMYAYDNRSSNLVDFSTCTGEFVYDFGTDGYYNLNTWIIANHNLVDFNVQNYTGTAWYTVTAYSNNSATTNYYNNASTSTQITDTKIVFTKTVNSDPAYFGEFIATKKKFQLNYNPSTYVPSINPVGISKTLWDGRSVFNQRSDAFSANLGWGFLIGDANTLTNTDLQNVTELFRKKTSFLFWPNADNTFPNMFTWRKQDIYKCKCLEAVNYEFPAAGLTYIVKANYTIREVN